MSKRFTFKTLVVMCLLLSFASAVMAAVKFSDIKSGHWAEDSINWGVDKGIVEGYSDNTFKPNNAVTNAEFLKMLVSSYDIKVPAAKEGEKWFDPYFSIAAENNWSLFELENYDSYSNEPISRGQVALLIASADGNLYTFENDAIQYLYEKDYSNGKKGKTIEGYKAQDTLNRAEAIKFVNNFADLRTSDVLKPAKAVEKKLPVNSIEVFATAVDKFAEDKKLTVVSKIVSGNANADYSLSSEIYGNIIMNLSYYTDTNSGKPVVKGYVSVQKSEDTFLQDLLNLYSSTGKEFVSTIAVDEIVTTNSGVQMYKSVMGDGRTRFMVTYYPEG